MSRAWTPGPLDIGVRYNEVVADCAKECDPVALLALYALAPEMAEFVLAWSAGQHGDFDAAGRASTLGHALADKLRAIDKEQA